MSRFSFSVLLLCLTTTIPQVMAHPAAHPAAQPDAQQVQNTLDRLVQEPLRYEGISNFAPVFRQQPGYVGREPMRVLIGYRLEGARLQGEFVVLDADNRALQAASLSGQLTRPAHDVAGDRGHDSHAGSEACMIDIALSTPLHLEGQCASSLISGAYVEKVSASPLMFILPGMGASEAVTGQYMMQPWRR